MVIYLCLLFWYDKKDEFDPNLCGKNMKLKNDNATIEYIESIPNWHTCYGKKIIPSMSKNITYTWKYKNVSTYKICSYDFENFNKCVHDLIFNIFSCVGFKMF